MRERHTPPLAALLLTLGCEYASEGPVLVSTTPSGTAGSAPAASSCGDARDIACLDFEDESAPIPSLVLMTPTGSASYDSTSSAVGAQSVRLEVAAEANYVVEVVTDTAITSGPLHLRALFRVAGGAGPVSYVVLMEALSAEADAKISFDWRPQGFGINSNGTTQYSDALLPRDRWFCAELAIVVGATAGSVQLSLDGATAAELTMLDTSLGTGLTRYRVGINGGPGNPALLVNVDDFVVRAAPIGCP